MDYAKEQFVELGVALTGLAVKGTASTIQKKIGASKARKDDKKTITLRLMIKKRFQMHR